MESINQKPVTSDTLTSNFNLMLPHHHRMNH